MLYIEPESKDAAFHFSAEEYIVRDYPWDEPVMMVWQADRCAMLGCNQIAQAEIDMDFAKHAGIQIIRRSSGGGTIYTDMGTLLYTVIVPYTEDRYPPDIAKEDVAGPVVGALNMMGIHAVAEGRNDLIIDGRKISGLAQYIRHGRICTHGSLLYNTDLETLARVLRGDGDKIRSGAVRSVRSRVTNIIEHMDNPRSIEEFLGLFKQNLFRGRVFRERSLSEDDFVQIDRIYQQRYGNPSWTFTQSPKYTFHNSKRFTGGRVEIFLDVARGVVTSCSIRGDFLGVTPIRGLELELENILFQYNDFYKALCGIPLQPYLGSITADEFLSGIFMCCGAESHVMERR